MTTTDKIIEKYLHFGGNRNLKDFGEFLKEIGLAKHKTKTGSEDFLLLEYVEKKIVHGFQLCIEYENIYAMIDEQSKEDIIEILKDAGYLSGIKKPTIKRKANPKKQAPAKKKGKKKSGLGKIVDSGQPASRGKADIYWKNEGIETVFKPNDPKVRVGGKIPPNYLYTDIRFLEKYYGLRGIEFGNWLSQQDRVNYLSGFGVALYDLHKALKFSPKQISCKGKLSVAFGARGSGKAMAHFEPGAFVINLTRYTRPPKVKTRPANFHRVGLIVTGGGVGAFAHEYGHALDCFGAVYNEKGDTIYLSGDRSLHTTYDAALMKQKTLRGLMENLMYKIIWKNTKVLSPYYLRLQKAAKSDYELRRNEIFARSFEVYVQYKLLKNKTQNVFLNEAKYNEKFYLSLAEMKKLEPDYDALISALKKHL